MVSPGGFFLILAVVVEYAEEVHFASQIIGNAPNSAISQGAAARNVGDETVSTMQLNFAILQQGRSRNFSSLCSSRFHPGGRPIRLILLPGSLMISTGDFMVCHFLCSLCILEVGGGDISSIVRYF